MALYLRKKLDNKAEIAVWQITESEEELLGLTSVPHDELEEIQLFRNESHRRQKLAVRALLNEMFEEKMYLNHHDNGKPYLENCATNIGITHTDKYVAVIIHDDEEVGVDIESLDRDFAVVEKKALSEDEIEDLDDDGQVELLVAGHHGAGTSTSQPLLDVVRPQLAAISVGADNPYGHPTQETLDRLKEFGCTVYRTDVHGTIIYRR